MTHGLEQPVVFDVQGDTLVGVLHPGLAPTDVGVLVVVGGPQYRAGSHRQFVHVARDLAAQGISTLRFDVRGMGDSSGAQRSFEHLGRDIKAAIDTLLLHQPQIKRVVLWGLCDGASAALLYLHEHADPRVAGLVLLNPWVRTASTQALTTVKHYYRQRLMQKAFWLKLLSGQVAGQALRSLWHNLRAARAARPAAGPTTGSAVSTDYTHRMQLGWAAFGKPVLLVLSGQDYTAKEFIERAQADAAWARNLQMPRVTRLDLAEADHTFSTPGSSTALQSATRQWLQHAIMTAPPAQPAS